MKLAIKTDFEVSDSPKKSLKQPFFLKLSFKKSFIQSDGETADGVFESTRDDMSTGRVY